MVGCFNITASLDHLDYDCVVVAGSVHVLGQCAKWSFGMRSKHTFTFGESTEWVHSTVHSAFYSRPTTLLCFTFLIVTMQHVHVTYVNKLTDLHCPPGSQFLDLPWSSLILREGTRLHWSVCVTSLLSAGSSGLFAMSPEEEDLFTTKSRKKPVRAPIHFTNIWDCHQMSEYS